MLGAGCHCAGARGWGQAGALGQGNGHRGSSGSQAERDPKPPQQGSRAGPWTVQPRGRRQQRARRRARRLGPPQLRRAACRMWRRARR